MLLVLVTDMSQSVWLVLLVCNATGVGDRLLRKGCMNTGVLTVLIFDRSVDVCIDDDTLWYTASVLTVISSKAEFFLLDLI